MKIVSSDEQWSDGSTTKVLVQKFLPIHHSISSLHLQRIPSSRQDGRSAPGYGPVPIALLLQPHSREGGRQPAPHTARAVTACYTGPQWTCEELQRTLGDTWGNGEGRGGEVCLILVICECVWCVTTTHEVKFWSKH